MHADTRIVFALFTLPKYYLDIFTRDITLNSAYKFGVHKDVRRGNLRPLNAMSTIRAGLVHLPRQDMYRHLCASGRV